LKKRTKINNGYSQAVWISNLNTTFNYASEYDTCIYQRQLWKNINVRTDEYMYEKIPDWIKLQWTVFTMFIFESFFADSYINIISPKTMSIVLIDTPRQ
jgi:hypothetical protein